MYCKKCGKFTGDDRNYCDDCLRIINEKLKIEKQATCYQQPALKPNCRKGSVMDGFKKALIGAILSIVSFVCFIYQLILLVISGVAFPCIPISIFTLLFTGVSVSCSIVSLVFGISSVKLFMQAKKENRVKPIPALALGIDSIITDAIFMTYQLFIYSIIIFAMIMCA